VCCTRGDVNGKFGCKRKEATKMATRKNSRSAPLALSSRAEMMSASALELMARQAGDEEQAGIAHKTATDILRIRAVAARKRYGEQVIERDAISTAHTHITVVEALQALRTSDDEAVRQRIDQVLVRIEQDHINRQLRLGDELEDLLSGIVASPVDPPRHATEEIVIDVPNIFKQIFGGQSKITRSRR
jgi:hypothetical protein